MQRNELEDLPASGQATVESAVVELALDAEQRLQLEEAMKLTGSADPSEVFLLALKELVERQRFLSWVAAHDRKERSGTA